MEEIEESRLKREGIRTKIISGEKNRKKDEDKRRRREREIICLFISCSVEFSSRNFYFAKISSLLVHSFSCKIHRTASGYMSSEYIYTYIIKGRSINFPMAEEYRPNFSNIH
jgi:hypothetical protein